MRRMSIASLVLVPLTAAAVVVTTGAAGPRPHSGTSSSYDSSVSTTTADTPDVKAWKDKIRKQAEGVPSFKSVPYTIDLNAKPKPVAQSDGSIPMVLVAYPASNCSLNMVVYKAKTSPTYAVASSLTSCLKKIGTIRHYIELWRLDTFGFTKRFSGGKTVYNTYSLAYDGLDICKTGFNRQWTGYVKGEVWVNGYYYKAEDWDDKWLACGGS